MRWPRLSAEVLPLLTIISPLIGVVTTVVMARWNALLVRPMALSNSAMTLLLIGAAVGMMPPAEPAGSEEGLRRRPERGIAWLAEESTAPIPDEKTPLRGMNVRLAFALDGLSAWPALILSLTVWAVLCCPGRLESQVFSSHCVWLMTSQTLLLASLFATDAVSSLVFFEISLVPTYFLLGVCGDQGRRPVASASWAWQMIGCSCSLLGVTLLAVSLPWMQVDMDLSRSQVSFDTAFLADNLRQVLARSESAWHLWSHLAPWSVLLVLAGFLVRLPMFPFQGWYQATLTAAPAGASALIAVAFPLVAFSGWLRLGMPLLTLDSGPMATLLGALSLIGFLQCGFAAQQQWDLKRFFATISCAMLCLACIGLSFQTSDGIRGAWLLMISQGLAVGGGMRLVQFLESRGYPRDLTRITDFASKTPRFMVMLSLLLLGWAGIPILSGFAAMILLNSGSTAASLWMILGQSIGTAAIAVAALRMFAQVTSHASLSTTASEPETDLTGSELAAVIPFIALLVMINVAPLVLMNSSEPALRTLLRQTDRHANAARANP